MALLGNPREILIKDQCCAGLLVEIRVRIHHRRRSLWWAPQVLCRPDYIVCFNDLIENMPIGGSTQRGYLAMNPNTRPYTKQGMS